MPTDNAAVLRYFLQDDIYLLKEDKQVYGGQPVTDEYPETDKPRFNYLGGNKSKFLILVNYPGEEFLDAIHLRALESTLSRKNLVIEDVAILNLAKHGGPTFAAILAFFAPAKILILGIDAAVADMPASVFNTIENKAAHLQLHTYSFIEMVADPDLKRPFWDQIKNF